MTERAEFVGRAREVAAFDALIERATDGQPTVAFVEGSAGIGKTRLLAEVADRVRDRGGLVLEGAAPPTAGEPMPFAAISRLLKDALSQLGPVERERVVQRSTSLGHLQPAWRMNPSESPQPTSSVALSDELVELVDALAHERSMVSVHVDDVQWADATTLDLLAYLARAPRESRVLVVIAARLDDLPHDAALRRMRAELLRVGAKSVALGPLPDADTSELLARLLGPDAPASRAAEITALGGGNPLFLRELAEAGAGEPVGRAPLPESLIALTRTRLTGLSIAQMTTLQIVATVGDGCTERLVESVLGQPVGITTSETAALVTARMLTRKDEGVIQVGSPVLREVVLADTLDAQLRRIRSAAARAIVADPEVAAGTEVERLIRLANLWEGAGDRIRALPALVRAAEAAESAYAFAAAFELHGRAMQIVDAPSPKTDRQIGFQAPTSVGPANDSLADLRGRAANSAILAGDPATAIDWVDRAVVGVRNPHARDRLLFTRARAMLALGDAAGAVATYRGVRAGDHGGEIVGSARIGYARALTAAGEASEAVAVAAAALVDARERHSRSDEETALLVLGTALTRSGNLDEGAARLHEATTLRQLAISASGLRPRASRVMDLTAGLSEAASAAEDVGLRDEAEILVRNAAGAAERWGATGESARLALVAASGAVHDGRWNDALQRFDEAVGHPATSVAALAGRARIGALRGAWDRAGADLVRAEVGAVRARPSDRAAFAMALAEVRSGRRQNEAAAAAATEGLVIVGDASPVERLELIALAVRAHVAAALAGRAVRSASEAGEHEAIGRALAAQSTRDQPAHPRERALAATVVAELSRLGPDAGSSWRSVREAWELDGSAWWIAYALHREAEQLLVASGGRDEAREVLGRGRSIALLLEAAPLLAEMDALATRGRIEPVADRTERPTPKPERKLPISDREMEVLVLIAKGLTNKEIASELFISERTAAHHVGHIFDKLGVSSRVEAAGVAHQAGVLSEA